MNKNRNKIAELLYGIFGDNAIKAGAICEQLDDAKFCTEHKMNHLNGGAEQAKWEKTMVDAQKLAENDSTFTLENMKKFQGAVNELLKNNPETRLYDGLSEVEHFAVRRFYYYNSH